MSAENRSGGATLRLRRARVAVALLAAGMLAALLGSLVVAPATAADRKVWVCKYVTKPGGGEILKSGKNPIEVSSSATVGSVFKDGQQLSYVIQAGGEAPTCPQTLPTPPPTSSSSSTSGMSSSSSGSMPGSAQTGGVAPWYDNIALLLSCALALTMAAAASLLPRRLHSGARH